jgi:hypothetical protein
MKKNYIAYIVITILLVIAIWPRKSGWYGTKYKPCDSGFVPHALNPGTCVKCPMGAVPGLITGCSNIGGGYAFGAEERTRQKL